ncbi:MAG: hypothetical protein QM496_02880 [Verrucomicrobiota bacterium]
MKDFFFILALGLCVLNTALSREWTDVSGKKVKADFISSGDGKVYVKRERDGKKLILVLEKLSTADRKWLAERMQKTGESKSVSVRSPFRELISGAEYREKMQVADSRLEAADCYGLAADLSNPAVGIKLLAIPRGSNAERAGIEKGSIIVKRGEWKSWAKFTHMISINEPYIAQLVNPSGKVEEVEMEPGYFDAPYAKVHRLDVAYLRGEIGTSRVRWDRHILVACFYRKDDPAFAETALYHAVKSGYQEDAFTDFLRTIIKMNTGEGPAQDMERFLSHFEGKDIPWVYIPPLHNVLAVTGRIDFMQRIVEEAGDNCIYDNAVIKQFLEWTEGAVKWPEGSLLDRAKANRGESITGIFDSARRMGGRVFPAPAIDEKLEIKTAPGSYYHTEYTSENIPQNFHYHIKAKMVATGLHRRWATRFRVSIADLYSEQEPIPPDLRFPKTSNPFVYQFMNLNIGSNFYNTVVDTVGNSLPGMILNRQEVVSIPFIDRPALPENLQIRFKNEKSKYTKEPQAVDIDLIRYHNEMGIYVNGICFLHLPTDPEPTRKIDFNIHAVGLNMTIEQQQVWALED